MAGWIFLSIVFFAVLAFLVIMRRIESSRIERKFNKDEVVITSYGVNYFGLSSEKGRIPRSSGILVLLKDAIYYRARFSKRELLIPGKSIRSLKIVETHKGKPLYQKSIAIDFINNDGTLDTAAFRIPFPAQWLGAIKRYLLEDKEIDIRTEN